MLAAEALAVLSLNFTKHLLQRLATCTGFTLGRLANGATGRLSAHLAPLGAVRRLFIGFELFSL